MQMKTRGLLTALMMTTLVISPLAEAKRMGGGKSYGMSRSSNSSPSRNYNRPATPPPNQQPATAPQRSGPGVGGMVAAGAAGAAAGYMLGHSNEARAQQDPTATNDPTIATEQGTAASAQQEQKSNFGWLWILALAAAAFFIFRRFSAKKATANGNPFAPSSGANRQSLSSSGPFARNNMPAASHPGTSDNTNIFGQTVGASSAVGGAYSSSGNALPDGTEPAAFLRQARAKFLHLQSMNSSSNIEEVRRYFTADMYTAIREEILSNDDLAEFPQLNAQVVDSGNENGQYFASVEFSGTVSESVNAQAVPFSEIWHFVKPQNGSEWLVAGIQQQ
ncbi:Tim44 domain-containing protein [Alkanindiges sp. WGS2144]|uniref:Tim44 domain-containing protein n=1 Tax=Alkanindiges sp. WGS2144 TaxID=3366808 RepID=UPI0037529855